MPNNNGDITFKYGTQEAYNGLSSIDENAIYITTDTHRIYIGGADYTDDTQMNNATKQYIDNIASIVNSRVDNIIAYKNDTEGNSELIDIRHGQDGITYQSAGQSVRTQIGKIRNSMDTLFTSENNYLINNLTEYTGVATSSTKRVFLKGTIPENAVVDRMTVYIRYYTGILYFELWELENNQLSLVKTVSLGDGETALASGDYQVNLNYIAQKETMISFYGSVAGSGFAYNSNGESYVVNDLSSSTLTFDTTSVFSHTNNGYCMQIPYTVQHSKLDAVKGNIIRIGKGCDYEDIQTALENCNDSAENPVTFLIMPGVYDRFSTVRTLDNMVNGPANVSRQRYVSFIGANKKDCIIRSDLGEYYMPAAEIRTNGIIKNLTFISTHDDPPALSERSSTKKAKAYSVHSDFGTEDALFEDCVFISYQAPAVGIGLYQDKKIEFRRCDFYNLSDSYTEQPDNDWRNNYTYTANYGAIYAHGNMSVVTNQRITLDNCRFRSPNGDKGIWIAAGVADYNSEMIVNAMNCMAVCKSGGTPFFASKYMTLSEEGFGNNFEFVKQP